MPVQPLHTTAVEGIASSDLGIEGFLTTPMRQESWIGAADDGADPPVSGYDHGFPVMDT